MVSDPTGAPLAEHHLAALAASGITAEHAARRGYETITDSKRLAEIAIVSAARRHVPGLLVPMLAVDGSTWGWQYKPDQPRLRDGKPVKYETPWQQRNGLDVPPGVGPMLGDPSVPLWITEGCKKADCGALHGLCIVALSGVWNWLCTNSAGGKLALPDFQDIALNGRDVVIAFDGDTARKESVQKAAHSLSAYLAMKGAKVRFLHLPDSTNGKVGLDDYLAEHTVEDLMRLVKPTQPQPQDAVPPPDANASQPPPRENNAALIDGAELLGKVEKFVGQYLVLANENYLPTLTLWIVHTWAMSAFYTTPRLVIDSPEPGSAKTRVLEILALLSRGAKLTLSTTTAALYRRISAAGDNPPTILQDEADAVFGKASTPQTEDLRALYNSGYRRGATVDRCEGDKNDVREWVVFAPAALAGIAGKMPDTITSRAVTIHMRKRAPSEPVTPFRERFARKAAEPIRDEIEVWAAAHLESLSNRMPAMPDGVEDRPAEIWEALLAIADEAGGDWPERARDACEHFVFGADEVAEPTLGIRLLRDVKEVFGASQRMFSVDIVSALLRDLDKGWADIGYKQPLTQARLAKELKRYGIVSSQIRIGEGQARGYKIDGDDGLQQAWDRYLVPVDSRPKRPKSPDAGEGDIGPSQTRPTGVPHPEPDVSQDEMGHTWDGSENDSVPTDSMPDQEVSDAGTAGTPGTGTAGDRDLLKCEVCQQELTSAESVRRGYCEECKVASEAGAA